MYVCLIGGAGHMNSMGIMENKRLLEQKKGEMQQVKRLGLAISFRRRSLSLVLRFYDSIRLKD